MHMHINIIKMIIPINQIHAVFRQNPIVKPEPDIYTSAKEE